MHITMTRDDLKGHYSERFVSGICSKVAEEGDFAGFVRQFMYDEDQQIVRNAFAALTKATNEQLLSLMPLMPQMVELAMSTKCPSIRRPLLGIIERLPMPKETVRTDFLDFCMDRMYSFQEAPSVQALCLKIAYKICANYPELMDELIRTLQAMEMDYYKPAVRSVRKRILSNKFKRL